MNEKHIWDFLLQAIGNPFGAAGLMGNLYAESALNPRNLQQSFEKKLGYTDDSYTEAVDSGAYANFVHDGAGYGLAQWTYWSRKRNLLSYAKKCGVSISDLDMQLAFLIAEIKGYASVWDTLRTVQTVREASDAVLLQYERPKDQSESVRVKREGYGKRYYDAYATNNGGDKQMATVKLGSARIDENGHATGGKAGDQTGKEVSTQNWYKHRKGWRVFRARDPEVAEKIARCMQAACDNPKIGYDQYQRNTLYNAAKPLGFDCAKVATACETDCSALVRVCCAYAGVMLPDIRTTNEPKALLDSGAFVELTGAKYTDQADYLRRGDILCTRTQGHTVVVLTSGGKASAAEPLPEGLRRGDSGDDVRAMQRALLAWDATCLPGWGADGDFGSETERAVRDFQACHEELTVTGVYDEATRELLTFLYGDARPAPQEEPVQPAPGTPAKYVEIKEIHVRSAPGDKYQSLGIVQPGFRLPYQGETHTDDDGVPWLLVEYDGQNGWVCGLYGEVI